MRMANRLWPNHPEPITVPEWRRVELVLLFMIPILASLNVLSRFAVVGDKTADVGEYDRFLWINLPAHATAWLLFFYAYVGERNASERSERIHRLAVYAGAPLLLWTSITGAWLLGSVTLNQNIIFVLVIISITRVYYDARLGLWAFAWGFGLHLGLVVLERLGVIRSQAYYLPPYIEARYNDTGLVVMAGSWIAAAYVMVWAMTSYVAHRFRSSEHELRELNASLEERVQRQVSELARAQRLRRYVAPQLADQILAADVDPVSVRERRPITVMFADLRGFTPMVERVAPAVLADILNRYFDEVAQVAFRYGGTIDKFIGDAVMVFFGAPTSLGEREQARRCVQMAIEIQRRVRELGQEFVSLGADAPLEVRIGIASGIATVGSFGAAHRSDFTVVGAAVNRAARLEPLAKPGGILIDEETRALVGEGLVADSAIEVVLKGFTQPVNTYSVTRLSDVPRALS